MACPRRLTDTPTEVHDPPTAEVELLHVLEGGGTPEEDEPDRRLSRATAPRGS